MNWISNVFLTLLIGILGFGLYQFQVPDSSTSKQEFKRTVGSGQVSRGTNSGTSIQELEPSLHKLASNVGFEADTVQRHALDRELTTFDENTIRLDEYDNHWLLLNFWASWCLPCREEMPSLERLQDEFDSRTLRILAVNVMEPRDEIQKFITKENLSLPVVLDPEGTLTDAFGVEGLPVTWVISPDGEPLMRLRGSLEWDRGKVVRLLSQLTEQR